eukprot:gnl/TRDRNA2_/TRDRNA2_96304_c0_seq2.p1 gnl/TRDRNA2_/TRDRNA2_96304_c0~~gnl/TRDRNA2_/TRDRNA2_96304_c0_seq2.p1  ORF type:complete len:347 (+),score=43.26 gnl/TRDRNA2_/TRDRNA2_96304_c0_seq2:99-1139(+)
MALTSWKFTAFAGPDQSNETIDFINKLKDDGASVIGYAATSPQLRRSSFSRTVPSDTNTASTMVQFIELMRADHVLGIIADDTYALGLSHEFGNQSKWKNFDYETVIYNTCDADEKDFLNDAIKKAQAAKDDTIFFVQGATDRDASAVFKKLGEKGVLNDHVVISGDSLAAGSGLFESDTKEHLGSNVFAFSRHLANWPAEDFKKWFEFFKRSKRYPRDVNAFKDLTWTDAVSSATYVAEAFDAVVLAAQKNQGKDFRCLTGRVVLDGSDRAANRTWYGRIQQVPYSVTTFENGKPSLFGDSTDGRGFSFGRNEVLKRAKSSKRQSAWSRLNPLHYAPKFFQSIWR